MNNDVISRSALLEQECFMDDDNGFRCSVVLSIDVRNAPAVDAGPKWISVEERLPEDLPENKGKKVIPCLVSLKSTYPNGKPNTQKRQRQLQYYGSNGGVWEWSRIGASRVTHWMPLPEPPEVPHG